MKLAIKDIRIDGGTQSRESLNQDVVSEYAQLINDGATLPSVTVFFDGVEYWLADGFHRYFAHKKIELSHIESHVKNGTQREAQLYSFGANCGHGLRRTNADKRIAILKMLKDGEWATWSNEIIAKTCMVSPHTVADVKKSISANAEIPKIRKVERNGTVYEQNTSNIGAKTKQQKEVEPQLLNGQKSEPETIEPEYTELDRLQDENSELRDRIIDLERLCQIGEIDTGITDDVMDDAKKQIKDLEANLKAVTSSRDFYMNENAQLKRQLKLNKKVA